MSGEPQWLDGPPVPRKYLAIAFGSQVANGLWELRWSRLGEDPLTVVDRPGFEAAILAIDTGVKGFESCATLEKLGYQITWVEPAKPCAEPDLPPIDRLIMFIGETADALWGE